MEPVHFYDIPVYRLSEDRYYRARAAFIDSINPNPSAGWRDLLERSYGGCWNFNEIIGYIRLHFFGSQVRGEYFGVRRKRIVKTRTNLFEWQHWKLAPEVEVPNPVTRENILSAILEYLEMCKKELPKRYIDTSVFEAIAAHVNWVALFRSTSRSHSKRGHGHNVEGKAS